MQTVYTCDGDPPMCDNKGIREEEVRRGEQRGEKEGWRGHYTDSHNRDCSEYDTSGVCSILKELRPE